MVLKKWLSMFVLVFLLTLVKSGFSSEINMVTSLQKANISFSRIFDVHIREEVMYVATDQGIYQSLDDGLSWQSMPSAQLPISLIQKIVYSLSYGLVASSSKDVYQLVNSHWQHVYRTIDTQPIIDLDVDGTGEVILITSRGIVSLSLGGKQALNEAHEIKKISYNELAKQFDDEPTIQEIQQWSIQYADVHPEKIERWREEARRRAWFPSLNLGMDGGRDWDFNDSIWGTSSGNHYIGPDDKSFGKDIGFDISLSWDLADLVWSTDQTSIDNRSKLMVELREDILDQVTRLYFERRRLQMELLTKTLTTEQSLQHHLRIDELTALIDGFTGGQFSLALAEKMLQQVVRNH